ncbi:hypothetical protein AVEN_184366-1 [Araneus ventricosus]|uniref:Uncharacterized protein n=1 Tax=Araneus ventricosus TaxID=182803 RepID=A0A4Y2IAL8_ARAVE|nr:hypothetical protein AVEN_184366-1 [Araneus ventricosus]
MCGYRTLIPSERRVVETINVGFDEVRSGAVLNPKSKNLGSNLETDSEVDNEIAKHGSSDEVKGHVETEITKEMKPESLTEIKKENFDENSSNAT